MSTSARSTLLSQERYAFLLLVFAAVLCWASAFQAALLVPALKQNLFSGAEYDLRTIGPVVLVMVLFHYMVLVELPFWWGQSAWKQAELQRTGNRLSVAQSIFETEAARDDVNSSDGRSPGLAILAAWANYTLAQEQLRAAERIPEHTVSDAVDLAAKLGFAVISSIVVALVLHLLSLK